MKRVVSRRRRSSARGLPGFTLFEVMLALALLAFAMSVLMKSASNTTASAARAHMLSVATDLSRGKMYDIEEILLKDGFTDTDQSQDGRDFGDEGWPQIKYSYKVEQVELPSWDDLQAMSKQQAEGSGAGSGSAALGSNFGGDANSFQNSALGGMLSSLGGGFGGAGGADVDAKNGASFIQGQYSMVSEVLKVSIRKVTLDVIYPVQGNDPEHLVTVAYFTDAAAMDKVLMGLGSQEIQDNSGSGSGSGSGRGSGSGSGRGSGSSGGTRPTRPGSGK